MRVTVLRAHPPDSVRLSGLDNAKSSPVRDELREGPFTAHLGRSALAAGTAPVGPHFGPSCGPPPSRGRRTKGTWCAYSAAAGADAALVTPRIAKKITAATAVTPAT